jgi:hypothetical protein
VCVHRVFRAVRAVVHVCEGGKVCVHVVCSVPCVPSCHACRPCVSPLCVRILRWICHFQARNLPNGAIDVFTFSKLNLTEGGA